MERSYSDFCIRKCSQYPNKFSTADLAPQFIPYFESGQRIKVQFSYGEEKSGIIGITTGWKPVFLLMLASNHVGSSYTLSADDKIIAVKTNSGKYQPI